MRARRRIEGFTLIETVATLTIISIITVGLISFSEYVSREARSDETYDRMNEVRRAIGGNPLVVVNEARTSFGYVGDMGSLPPTLSSLWVRGMQPAYTFNTDKKTGAGWLGPYLDVEVLQFISALGRDGWGNGLVYTPVSFTNSTFAAPALGRLASLGADLTSGQEDFSIDFFASEFLSKVQGFVKDSSGDPVPGVGVTVNYPVEGVLTSRLVQADSAGFYSFSDIPFGNRSITIDPKLVLAPDTTMVSGNAGQDLRFTIKNFSASAIGVTSMSLAYTVSPDGWFDQVKIGPTTVWDYPSNPARIGNLDSFSFAQQSIAGTGKTQDAIGIRLQSPLTDVGDIEIGDVGNGGTLAIELNGFNNSKTGNGTDVEVTGISFEVTFKNAVYETVGVVVVRP